MAWEMIRFWRRGYLERYWIEPSFHFVYPGFEWLPRLTVEAVYLLALVIGLSGLLLGLGVAYRASSVVFTASYFYLFVQEQSIYNNHFYLIFLLGILFCVTDADRWGGLNARQSGTLPRWHLWVFRFQFLIVYFFGGIAKLNPDWLAGQPMRLWMASRQYTWVDSETLAYSLSYGGLFFDLDIGYLLLWPPVRWLGMVLALFFHWSNAHLFSIGIFPYLGVAALVLFYDPKTMSPKPKSSPVSKAVLLGLVLWSLFQVLIPLRHWVYPGDVFWNELGHRFSWRMKLRSKRGKIEAFLRQDGQLFRLDFPDLERSQVRKMKGNPAMLVDYARRLRRTSFLPDSEFVFKTDISLNGRPPQPLVDSNVDLSRVKSLGPGDWIHPGPTERLPIHPLAPRLISFSLILLTLVNLGLSTRAKERVLLAGDLTLLAACGVQIAGGPIWPCLAGATLAAALTLRRRFQKEFRLRGFLLWNQVICLAVLALTIV